MYYYNTAQNFKISIEWIPRKRCMRKRCMWSWVKCPFWGQKEFFSEYLIVPILFTYSTLSLCKISKKSFLWILRKRCTRLWAQFGVKMPPILGPNIVFLKIQYCHFLLLVVSILLQNFKKNLQRAFPEKSVQGFGSDLE